MSRPFQERALSPQRGKAARLNSVAALPSGETSHSCSSSSVSIGNFAIGRGQSGQRLFLDDTNLGFGDRLDGNAVLFSAFQSEDISCEIKTSNLPTSFSEHLRGANGTVDDLVYAVGGIIFANDLAFAGIRSDDADAPTRRAEHYY